MPENRRHVNGELLFLAQNRFTALVQKICNWDEIHNDNLTLNKVLNVLIHRSLHASMMSGRLGNR